MGFLNPISKTKHRAGKMAWWIELLGEPGGPNPDPGNPCSGLCTYHPSPAAGTWETETGDCGSSWGDILMDTLMNCKRACFMMGSRDQHLRLSSGLLSHIMVHTHTSNKIEVFITDWRTGTVEGEEAGHWNRPLRSSSWHPLPGCSELRYSGSL